MPLPLEHIPTDLTQKTSPNNDPNTFSSLNTIKPVAGISPMALDKLNARRAARGEKPKEMPAFNGPPVPVPTTKPSIRPNVGAPTLPLATATPTPAAASPRLPQPTPSPMPKTGSNKYATTYFDAIKDSVNNYKPFNGVDASTIGAPVGAAVGGLAGAAIGAAGSPGYDAQGQKKSRLRNAILGALAGGTIGGLGAAAVPAIAQGGLKTYATKGTDVAKGLGMMDNKEAYRAKIEALKLRLMAPQLRIRDLQ